MCFYIDLSTLETSFSYYTEGTSIANLTFLRGDHLVNTTVLVQMTREMMINYESRSYS